MPFAPNPKSVLSCPLPRQRLIDWPVLSSPYNLLWIIMWREFMNLVSEIQSSEGIPYIECTLGKEGNTQYLCGNFFFLALNWLGHHFNPNATLSLTPFLIWYVICSSLVLILRLGQLIKLHSILVDVFG